MTKLLSEMFEKVKRWPASRQEDAALMLQEMERQGTNVYKLSDEERTAVEEGLREIERGSAGNCRSSNIYRYSVGFSAARKGDR